jgi:hypothetical protein
MARSLVAWFASAAAVGLVFQGCATGEDSGLGGGVGGGGYGNSGTECEPPTCNCGTCYGTCVCAGTDPQQCLHVCSGSNDDSGVGGSGTGGSPLFGGAGGGGAVGGSGALGGSGNVGGSGAVGGGSTGGSGGVPSGGTGGTGGVGNSGGSGGSSSGTCCSIQTTPGCSNASIQSCVCATDSYCCTDEWDDICVDEVDTEGCGTCGAGGGGGTGGGTSTCSVELTDPLCNACMQQACCAPAEGCFNNTSCSALINCIVTACPTAASVADFTQCADTSCPQYSSSKPLLVSYLNCISTSCASSCGL